MAIIEAVLHVPANLVHLGNATYAAGSAAFVANAVLVGYIIVAALEDTEPEEKTKEE